MNRRSPFRSFWMGGFEGADHVNAHGLPLDMASSSGHLGRLDEDLADAAAHGLRTVRESIGWRLSEVAPGRFDFARLRRIAAAAARADVQVLWTLMHYGTPSDLDLFDDRMIDRFAAFAAAVAHEIGPRTDEPPVYTLVDEIGFVAWAASETNLMGSARRDADDPHACDGSLASGYDVKRRLVRAVLAAIDAVRRVDPRARFMHVEPLVHVVAPRDRPELGALAAQVADYQWQAWDLIGGLAEPGLGGSTEALDLVGVNHYHSGQWEVVTEERLWWHLRDERRRPFAELLDAAWRRYARPLVVAETSHVGAGRDAWLDEVGAEVERARQALGVPVEGVCLYPLVDRLDWNDAAHWHRSGLWDAVPGPAGRRLCVPYARAIERWRRRLP